MAKICRVKQRTKKNKRKPKFFIKKNSIVNNVGIDVNISSVNMESSFVNTNINVTSEDINVNRKITVEGELSASAKKIKNVLSSRQKLSGNSITGYRLIDLEILNSVFSTLRCPECMSSELSLSENEKKRKGLASCLYVRCSACDYSKEFYSSIKNKQKSFDINTRVVYAMRSCGQGYSGFSRFVSLMDLPKPMTFNNYNKIVLNLTIAAKSVAENTIIDAAQELKDLKSNHLVLNSIPDHLPDVTDVAVSCDGTWQRRGYSSNNGIVSVISMETGKVLDVEAMNKLSIYFVLFILYV